MIFDNRRANLVLAALVAAVMLAGAAPPAVAQQQAGAELQRKEPSVMMGEQAFRRFDALTALYTDGKYQEALTAAQNYLGRSDLNNYERAMGEQIYGYVLIGLDRVNEAVPRFERAIELDALPNSAHFNMMRALAQLYASREEWQKSINMMNEYLRFQAEPTPEDRIMMGQNYAQLERYRDALPWVRGAIQGAGGKALESWYQLELAIHFELKDYRAALEVLRVLVARWPNKLRYWEMMAGAHQELNQDVDALAALMAAYNGGLVTDQAKILNLVRMSMYVELPFQAGQILDRAIEQGKVEPTAANLRLLLQAWTGAREYDRAGRVIDRLAPMTGEGDLFMQKARLMLEQNQWQATIDAARQALDLGNVTSPGGAWLMIGIAAMELGNLRESRQAFQQAQEFDADTRRQAREWQRFVEDRIQVAELRSGG
jgi:tetratricopeptide (TPR) repeat protein